MAQEQKKVVAIQVCLVYPYDICVNSILNRNVDIVGLFSDYCLLLQADQGPSFSLPNEWFRFGVIPAGSTDAVVIWYFLPLPSVLFSLFFETSLFGDL